MIAVSCGHSIFSFLEDLHAVFIVAVPTYIPTNSVGGFSFLYNLSSIQFVDFFDDGHLTNVKW